MPTLKLKTENIFLDTSIFEESNFLDGRKINSLLEHAKEGVIKLFSSPLAITEVKERIRKNVQTAKRETKKIRKEKYVEVLRNTDTYHIFEKIWTLDFAKETEKICNKLDEIVKKTPIELITTSGVSIDGIFDKYFKNEAPFKEGLKKNEFPDAFILASIESWCKNNDCKMIVVSKDNDWLSYESKHLEKYDDLDKLLNHIATHREITLQEKRLSFIDAAFKKNQKRLIKDLKYHIEYKAYFDTGEADLDYYKISKIQFVDYLLTSLDEEKAELKVEARFVIKASVSYEDFENGYYDKEDDRWHFVETKHDEIEKELRLPVIIDIEYNFETEEFEPEITSVNEDRSIDIGYKDYGYSEMYK